MPATPIGSSSTNPRAALPRWTAIFYGNTPDWVGGTRSCRIIDNEIPAIFKSLLACSGMSGGTREFYLKPSDFNQEKRFFTPDFGDYTPMFYRSGSAPIPHNLMVVSRRNLERSRQARLQQQA